MKRIIRDYVFLAVLAAVIVTLDQLSKGWIRTNLAMEKFGRLLTGWRHLPGSCTGTTRGWLSAFSRIQTSSSRF